jgi:hypothetical protein
MSRWDATAACRRACAHSFEKTSCAVGQITGISSLSEEFKKPAPGNRPRAFSYRPSYNRFSIVVVLPWCRRIFEVPSAGAHPRGYDEKAACCGCDRRIMLFARSKCTGACGKRSYWRGVGSRRSRTGWRGRWSFDWLHCRAGDRAFVGSGAFRIPLAPSADTASNCRSTGSCGPWNAAAAAETCRGFCSEERAANSQSA